MVWCIMNLTHVHKGAPPGMEMGDVGMTGGKYQFTVEEKTKLLYVLNMFAGLEDEGVNLGDLFGCFQNLVRDDD